MKGEKSFDHLRSHMLDWILEIFEVYKLPAEVFYACASFFDEICKTYKTRLNFEDIHLIGICSMLLASKLENSTPFTVTEISKHISHNKFSKQEIILHESLFLNLLHFRLHK